MNTRTAAVLLVGLGGLLIRLSLSDRLLAYVRASTRPEALASGIAMSLVGVCAVLASHRGSPSTRSTMTPALLLIPALALVLIPAPGQGVQLTGGVPARHAKPAGLAPPLAGPEPITVQVSDFVTRAQWDRPSLRGRELRLVGFGQPGSGRVLLARLSITCCAADAQEDDIELTGPVAGGVAAHRWIAVVGRFAGMSSWQAAVPVLAVESITPVPAPADPYD